MGRKPTEQQAYMQAAEAVDYVYTDGKVYTVDEAQIAHEEKPYIARRLRRRHEPRGVNEFNSRCVKRCYSGSKKQY